MVQVALILRGNILAPLACLFLQSGGSAEALRWGGAAGAVAVMSLGALPSLHTVEEVEAL
jgi:sugar/nucleoside kinase (ribokinase family)